MLFSINDYCTPIASARDTWSRLICLRPEMSITRTDDISSSVGSTFIKSRRAFTLPRKWVYPRTWRKKTWALTSIYCGKQRTHNFDNWYLPIQRDVAWWRKKLRAYPQRYRDVRGTSVEQRRTGGMHDAVVYEALVPFEIGFETQLGWLWPKLRHGRADHKTIVFLK